MPILFCYGAQEREPGNRFNVLIEGVHQVFEAGREEGASWALALHQDAEHENAQSRHLALRFFDTLIPKRLPDPLSSSTDLAELKRENNGSVLEGFRDPRNHPRHDAPSHTP